MIYNQQLSKRDLSAKKYHLFQKIFKAIVSLDNIGSLAELLVDATVNYCNAEKGSLMLANEKDELLIIAARGIDTELIGNYRAKIGEGVAGTVAKNRTSVLVEDIERDKRFSGVINDRYRTRSFISCPMISRQKVLGVININDKNDGSPFTEDEFELMKVIADHAAIAFENTFLLNQLRTKAIELEDANRQLMETDIAKTEYFTRVSHELRTPLNSIKGAIYYLQNCEEVDTEKRREFYKIISDETGELVTVVERVLDFIRMEDEVKLGDSRVINITSLIRDTLNSRALLDGLSKTGIKLSLDTFDSMIDIVGDKTKVAQLFINLIEGLAYYLKEGDSIHVTASDNDIVEIQIDLPRAMPETVFTLLLGSRKIFDPDLPENIVKLYMARRIAELHHWFVQMQNTHESCSVFLKISKSASQKLMAVLGLSMDIFVNFVGDLMNADICSIMLVDDLTGDLTIRSSRGLNEDVIKHTRIRPGDKIAGWVALEGKPLLIQDIEKDIRFGRKSNPQYNSKSLLSLPLTVDGKVVGVLNLNNKHEAGTFTERDLHIASLISERIAAFSGKLLSGELSEPEFKQCVKSFGNIADKLSKHHKKPMMQEVVGGLLGELGGTEEEAKLAEYITEIYDLGLLMISEDILKKKTFSASDKRTMKVHPLNTIRLLDKFEFSDTVKNIILSHHEHYDGSGYPNGLKKDAIPLLSRVIAVADSFCAMIIDRPYRGKMEMKEALEEIRGEAGSKYDPTVTEALTRFITPRLKEE